MNDHDDYVAAMAPITPEMRCHARFFFANESGRKVEITSIAMPGIGEHGGSGVQAVHLDPVVNGAEGPSPDGPNALWSTNASLFDDELVAYEFWIEFRPGGCTSSGGSISFPEWPYVVVSAGGRDIAIDPESAKIGFIGTEHSRCDG